MKLKFSIAALILVLPYFGLAQTTVFEIFTSKKKIANHYYKNKDYHTALLIYNSILEKNTKDTTVILNAARANKKMGYYRESYSLYTSLKDTSSFNSSDVLNMAELLLLMDQNEDAQKWFEAYARKKPNDMRIQNKLQKINNKDVLIEDSLSYIVSPAPFNSEYSEFYPILVDKDLIFLSNQPVFSHVKIVNSDNSYFFEIYRAPESNSKNDFELFHKQLSGKFHVGPFCFMNKGKVLILTLTDSKTKKLKLCFANKKPKGDWKISGSFPYNSKKHSVGHPFFHEEDSSLYFVSDMEGGFGGTDIFKSQLKNGNWQEPVNLGRPINSEGNEMFPYFHNDKFYFSSDGHRGLGGLDIFETPVENNKISKDIVNLGLPVNSDADDFAIYYTSNTKGYLSSNRIGGKGKDDIYSFSCKNGSAVAKVAEFNGTSLAGTRILITENNKKTIKDVITSATGQVSFDIKPGKTYKIHFEKEGYKAVDSIFTTAEHIEKEHVVSARLERRNKVYIKGIVKIPGHTLPSGKIKVINQQTGHIDTTSIRKNGEFNSQVDPDYSFIFVAQNDSLIGIKTVQNLPKKKGAYVSIVEMTMQKYAIKDAYISVMDSVTGKPLDYAYINIRNITTGEKQTVETDQQGNFLLKRIDQFDYAVTANCNELTSEEIKISRADPQQKFILIIK